VRVNTPEGEKTRGEKPEGRGNAKQRADGVTRGVRGCNRNLGSSQTGPKYLKEIVKGEKIRLLS